MIVGMLILGVSFAGMTAFLEYVPAPLFFVLPLAFLLGV